MAAAPVTVIAWGWDREQLYLDLLCLCHEQLELLWYWGDDLWFLPLGPGLWQAGIPDGGILSGQSIAT